MADKSKIQWCDATINPCYGCSPVSPACDNCYAARMAGRLGKLTEGTHKDGKWSGKINLFPERMEQALRWRKPRRIFVGSMTDLFHEAIPFGFLEEVFAFMRRAQQHTFLLLTKRAENMRSFMNHLTYAHHCGARGLAGWEWPPRNVWLGVTAEDQQRADKRIPILLDTPAAKRFVSIEPILGPIMLGDIGDKNWLDPECWGDCDCDSIHGYDPGCRKNGGDGHLTRKLDWVICGGESGTRARPMHPDWARSLRDQCAVAGVPFLFKQWGEWAPTREDPYDKAEPRRIGEHGLDTSNLDNCTPDMGNDVYVYRVGKHRAGRMLDGVEHNAFPEVRP